jgi:aspartate aminotransferase
MGKVQSQSTHAACSISQAAAMAALTGPQEIVRERSQQFQRRRDFVVEALNQAPGIHVSPPEGAFYVFPSCAGVIGKRTPDGKTIADDRDFTHYLLETEGVAVMHGSAYGAPAHLRISIAASVEVLGEACTRIRRACEVLR